LSAVRSAVSRLDPLLAAGAADTVLLAGGLAAVPLADGVAVVLLAAPQAVSRQAVAAMAPAKMIRPLLDILGAP
jgi:hypothetical protein